MSDRVLFCQLSIRTSAKGRPYLSGWLGKCRLVGFPGRPDKFGNETWDLFVTPAEERREEAPRGPMLTYSREDGPASREDGP